MVRRRKSGDLYAEATATAEAIHEQDQVVSAKAERERTQKVKLRLEQIHSREHDTRPIDPNHVKALVESIAVLGLIEPLVVDVTGVLLAGAHRKAALEILKETAPEIYAQLFTEGMIQVHMLQFEAENEPERALQIELAENEKRVNYTRDQITQLADRLRKLNYRDLRGRPKAGEKALGPALAVAIGVSTRYVRKVLEKPKPKKGGQENRNSVPILQTIKLLQKIEVALLELIDQPESAQPGRAEKGLAKGSPDYLKRVQDTLKELKSKNE
jgi:ParB family transcriptional regulator, chromosome partitioning protein